MKPETNWIRVLPNSLDHHWGIPIIIRLILPLLLILVLFLPGCSNLTDQSIPTTTAIPTPQPPKYSFTGRVIDMDGKPIEGAILDSQTNHTISNNDGWFELPSEGMPEWITAKSDGFISRTRAAAPSNPLLFRLTQDDGKTIVIQFGGDTMFGRRFFDPNEDGDTTDGSLPPDPDVEAHLKLLAPIEPLLGKSDLTVLNLESPLTDQPYFSPRDPRPTVYHDTKDYVFSSDTSAVGALKQMGVDAVDLGNNHLYDLLENGVQSTISSLDNEGMNHFGGGANEKSAWAPSILTVKGQKIAFIGCTTIGQPTPQVTNHDVTYVASDVLKKGGAAFCEESKLRSAVIQAKRDTNIVIVMIHGGFEYVRSPSNNITRLSIAARDSGATLVINHHPHVVGGFLWEKESLIAWSMGNFIFDQDVWPTFETYILTVYLRDGKIIRAYVDPLMIKDYVPHGLTGQQADHVIRIAASVTGPFVMESGTLEVDIDQHAIQKTHTQALDGGAEPGQIIAIPESQWLSNFEGTGKLLLGRDLLWIGGFESSEVDGASDGAPLWEETKDSVQVEKDFAYEGNSGIRLTRSGSNLNDVVTSHLHRLLVNQDSKLSITGMMRASPGAISLMQIGWYSDNRGPSIVQTTEPIETKTYNHWQPFRFDVHAPVDAVAVQVFLRLTPPAQGVVTADFDNLRVIEWAPTGSTYNPFYDHALLIGSGELTFTQQILPGAERWLMVPSAQQIK
jgi:poly-gamma-glutamate capsule biosynthesis protein CapA/YwtB (metallophosphatase superfamily)